VEVRGDGFFVFVLFADLLAAAIAFVDFATAKALFFAAQSGSCFLKNFQRGVLFFALSYVLVKCEFENTTVLSKKKKRPFLLRQGCNVSFFFDRRLKNQRAHRHRHRQLHASRTSSGEEHPPPLARKEY
jgi:hypothetical protein